MGVINIKAIRNLIKSRNRQVEKDYFSALDRKVNDLIIASILKKKDGTKERLKAEDLNG